MASWGVLYIMYPDTIPIPQNLNHINQESHQTQIFSPVCWYETKANRNETLLKVTGFPAGAARFATTAPGGTCVMCNSTGVRPTAPRGQTQQQLWRQVSTPTASWCPALGRSRGCDAPQVILQGKKRGLDSWQSQSWHSQLHQKRSRVCFGR